MAQCLQGARVDRRLTGAAPDRREQLPELMHLRHALELFDVHFRYARRRRRPTTSEPAWTASEATIAIAKAGATPPGSSQNASTAKNARVYREGRQQARQVRAERRRRRSEREHEHGGDEHTGGNVPPRELDAL